MKRHDPQVMNLRIIYSLSAMTGRITPDDRNKQNDLTVYLIDKKV